MAWTIETGLQLTGRVYVSSDSPDYLDIAYVAGAKTIIRPSEICTDEAGDYEVIRHAIEVLGLKDGLIVYLRPTTPFRGVSMVRSAITDHTHKFGSYTGDGEASRIIPFPDLSGLDSLRSVEEMTESAYKTFEIGRGFLDPVGGDMNSANAPNHLLPKTYRGNGYVDIVRVEYVLEYGELWGKCAAFITPKVIEIDTEFDFWIAEQSLKLEGKRR